MNKAFLLISMLCIAGCSYAHKHTVYNRTSHIINAQLFGLSYSPPARDIKPGESFTFDFGGSCLRADSYCRFMGVDGIAKNALLEFGYPFGNKCPLAGNVIFVHENVKPYTTSQNQGFVVINNSVALQADVAGNAQVGEVAVFEGRTQDSQQTISCQTGLQGTLTFKQ